MDIPAEETLSLQSFADDQQADGGMQWSSPAENSSHPAKSEAKLLDQLFNTWYACKLYDEDGTGAHATASNLALLTIMM